MAPPASTAVSGPVLSATLRARHARALGISLLLLVSVRLGGADVRAPRHRLPQAQNSAPRHEEQTAGRACLCCPAAIGRGRSRAPGSTPGAQLYGDGSWCS